MKINTDWNKAQSQANYKSQWEASQQTLARAQRENRVKDECLEIAVKALEKLFDTADCWRTAGETLANIEQRLAELEPEEETE